MTFDDGSLVGKVRRWRSTTVLSADGSRRAIVQIVGWLAVTPGLRRLFDLLAQDLRRAVEPKLTGDTVRTVYQMRRAVSRPAEVTIEVRPFQGSQELSRLRDLCRDAFAWNTAAIAEMEELIDEDGELRSASERLFVHVLNDQLDGFCWIRERNDEPGLGEIYSLGVAAGASGKGLGRQLLRFALADLRAHGVTTAVLNVDATNVHAVTLYVSEGFVVHRLERQFGAVPPIVEQRHA